jgi:DNA modification methylase
MSSKKGDIILDPFVGSGTTLIVAETLNRKGIGIDIDMKYKKIIEKRLLNEIKT